MEDGRHRCGSDHRILARPYDWHREKVETMKVQRFGITENEIGGYVRYSDYADLEKRFFASNKAISSLEYTIARLQEELTRIAEALEKRKS